MTKKLTYEFVKGEIEKEGYKLLSKEYKNNKEKLEIQCPKGHIYKVSYNKFQHGQRCPICYFEIYKLTYEFIKGKIEKEGYKLLSKEYNNCKTKLEIQCPKGHIYKVIYSNFQQGQRCPICIGNQKLTYEFVKGEIEKEGYKLLSKEYKNNKIKLKLQCPEGHEFEIKYGKFQQGRRCPECYDKQKLIYEFVKGVIEKEGYKLLSNKYVNNHTKLKLQCPEGHEFEMGWNSFKQGQRCPKCSYSNGSSKGEIEVLEYINSLTDTTIVPNDRSQILNPKTGWNLELDIFLPDIMKAIEYNGTYWHSGDDVIYKDKQKVIQCRRKNIDLLVINDEYWHNNKDNIKQQLLNWINLI